MDLKRSLLCCFISPEWKENFHNVAQFLLLTCIGSCSDSVGEWWYEAKLSPFRFEHMRLSDEGFKDRVGECWRSYTFLGSPDFVLVKN